MIMMRFREEWGGNDFPMLLVEGYCRNSTIAQYLDLCKSFGGYPDIQVIHPSLFKVTIVLGTVVPNRQIPVPVTSLTVSVWVFFAFLFGNVTFYR